MEQVGQRDGSGMRVQMTMGGVAAAFALVVAIGVRDGVADNYLKGAYLAAAASLPVFVLGWSAFAAKTRHIAIGERCIAVAWLLLALGLSLVSCHVLGNLATLILFAWVFTLFFGWDWFTGASVSARRLRIALRRKRQLARPRSR